MEQKILVRELEERDVLALASYWVNAEPGFLRGMGADPDKIPSLGEWVARLSEQIALPYHEKKSYCTIWEIDGKASGHCNVNNIVFGEKAHMHLHIWYPKYRNSGLGSQLVKASLPFFFNNLNLQKLICEPSSFNPAPNRTLLKLGFSPYGSRTCIPGQICFEQEVNTWEMDRSIFLNLDAGPSK